MGIKQIDVVAKGAPKVVRSPCAGVNGYVKRLVGKRRQIDCRLID